MVVYVLFEASKVAAMLLAKQLFGEPKGFVMMADHLLACSLLSSSTLFPAKSVEPLPVDVLQSLASVPLSSSPTSLSHHFNAYCSCFSWLIFSADVGDCAAFDRGCCVALF